MSAYSCRNAYGRAKARLSEHGRKVSEVMTAEPFTVTEDFSLADVVALMESKNVKRLPVMRGEKVVRRETGSQRLARILTPREIDVVRMANELEKKLGHIKTPLNVSVLGCVVNGIGEGKEADIGIAGGEGKGILFKKGKLVRKVPMEELMDTLIVEVEQLAKEKEAEGNGEVVAPVDTNGWESLAPQSDRPSTLGKEIPVLPHR